MVETSTKAAKNQDTEKAQEKKRRLEPAPLPAKVLADESVPFTGLLGVSAMEIPLERHAAFLGDSRFSHPANNTQKAGTVTELQTTYGNQYVQRLVESSNFQAKITVSSPDDQYEKEADRVADAITRAPASSVQRQAEPEEEEEEEPIQTKPEDYTRLQRQAEEEEEEEGEEPIQTKKAGGQTPLIRSNLQSRISSLKGSGQPLPESTRSYFEPRFGADFGQVRVHTDSKASETAEAIHAEAFTSGKDVVFNVGQYSPETSIGKRLLAHELTHVIQQSGLNHGYLTGPHNVVQAQSSVKRLAQTRKLANSLRREATIRYAHNFETVWRNAHSLPRAKHGILERICLEHAKWEREFGYEYRLLIHLLIKKGYKISTPKGSSEREKTKLSSQETVITSISDRKNRRRLWRVPFWEVMPKLRRLVTKKYGFEAYNPRAVLDRVLRSQQFFVGLANLGQIKWVQLLYWYRRGLFTDYWLLPKSKQKAYANNPGPDNALDFRKWLPKMLLDTWRYKEPDTRLAIELGELDKDLKAHKNWVAAQAKHSTYFGMEYLRDFHMIRALNNRSLLKLGGWVHEFYGTKWYSPGRWAKSSYKRRLPR